MANDTTLPDARPSAVRAIGPRVTMFTKSSDSVFFPITDWLDAASVRLSMEMEGIPAPARTMQRFGFVMKDSAPK